MKNRVIYCLFITIVIFSILTVSCRGRDVSPSSTAATSYTQEPAPSGGGVETTAFSFDDIAPSPAAAVPPSPAASTPAAPAAPSAPTPAAPVAPAPAAPVAPAATPAAPAAVTPVVQEPPPPPPPPRSIYPGGFVSISAGTLNMGSPNHEQGRNTDESPQRQITLSAFYLAKYPVTQAEYTEIMGSNPSHFRGEDLPVEQVDWLDAIEYCNRRSLREGLTPVYSGTGNSVTWNREANGYRLPTEAEWEYACRAGTTTMFYAGNSINTNQANFNGTSPFDPDLRGQNRQRTTNVNTFAPNRWGLYDMHGNVSEWCWDRYGTYSGFGSALVNTAGPASGYNRVLRGGSFDSSLPQLRSAARSGATPEGTKLSHIGFRIARNN